MGFEKLILKKNVTVFFFHKGGGGCKVSLNLNAVKMVEIKTVLNHLLYTDYAPSQKMKSGTIEF